MTYTTEDELAKLVSTNMVKAEVTTRFGEPDNVMGPQGRILRWDFFFVPEEKPGPRRFAVSGLTVYWMDEKMIRWAPAYGTIGGKSPSEFMKPIQPQGETAKEPNVNRSISFWPVGQQPIEGCRYIDTTSLPRLGWIAKEPALQVAKLKSVEAGHETVNYDGKNPREEYRFDVTLLPEDAEAFKKLTERSMGKNLLIMAGEQPVMAPRVNTPIVSGRFVVTVEDQNRFDALKNMLTGMIAAP